MLTENVDYTQAMMLEGAYLQQVLREWRGLGGWSSKGVVGRCPGRRTGWSKGTKT